MEKFIKIKDTDEKFRVNNIYCIGKNYLEHIKEFKNQEIPTEPVVFCKPNSSVITPDIGIKIPDFNGNKISGNLQNETEIVIAIGKDGHKISRENSFDYIKGIAIGLDMTLRDIQSKAKEKGLPWVISKGFYTSSPISEIIPFNKISNPDNLSFNLKVNGEVRQKGNTSDMMFKIDFIISYLSEIFYLSEGDLIFTGTPEGISKMNEGDKLEVTLLDENSSELISFKTFIV
ncbi:MAG TPA: fumarylacetoacetate hydrolase family protein [Ignavibacteria bacterium]|nr:fumarylacetoacetate hydrolase family protein [Ignavibacteria bacterium]